MYGNGRNSQDHHYGNQHGNQNVVHDDDGGPIPDYMDLEDNTQDNFGYDDDGGGGGGGGDGFDRRHGGNDRGYDYSDGFNRTSAEQYGNRRNRPGTMEMQGFEGSGFNDIRQTREFSGPDIDPRTLSNTDPYLQNTEKRDSHQRYNYDDNRGNGEYNGYREKFQGRDGREISSTEQREFNSCDRSNGYQDVERNVKGENYRNNVIRNSRDERYEEEKVQNGGYHDKGYTPDPEPEPVHPVPQIPPMSRGRSLRLRRSVRKKSRRAGRKNDNEDDIPTISFADGMKTLIKRGKSRKSERRVTSQGEEEIYEDLDGEDDEVRTNLGLPSNKNNRKTKTLRARIVNLQQERVVNAHDMATFLRNRLAFKWFCYSFFMSDSIFYIVDIHYERDVNAQDRGTFLSPFLVHFSLYLSLVVSDK